MVAPPPPPSDITNFLVLVLLLSFYIDPFSFLLVDNRPAFPLPPQLRGLPLETDEERVYAAAATPDQGYLDVFGSNPNPYYQRTLLDYAKTWLHPIVECTKKHARNCPKNPTILDIIENGGNAQGYYADRPTIDIVFVGDLQPHRQRKGSTKRRDVQIEVEHAVRTDIASRAELFVLNMEAAVIGPAEIISKVPLVLEKRVQRIIRFLTNPVEGLGLSPSSVVINIANNHALDGKSRTSAKTTEAYLREAGFVVIGFRPIQNKKLSGKEMVVVVEVPVGSGDGSGGTAERSHAHKIGFVGWTNVMNFDPSVNNPSCKPGVHANEFKLDILTGPCQLLHIDWSQVKKELGLSLLIGTPHWGIENIAFPEMKDIEIGQTLIDRGFDMIAGIRIVFFFSFSDIQTCAKPTNIFLSLFFCKVLGRIYCSHPFYTKEIKTNIPSFLPLAILYQVVLLVVPLCVVVLLQSNWVSKIVSKILPVKHMPKTLKMPKMHAFGKG